MSGSVVASPRVNRVSLCARRACTWHTGNALVVALALSASFECNSEAAQGKEYAPTPTRGANQELNHAAGIIVAAPGDYLAKLRALRPGQTLVLAAGNYDIPGDVPGLPIFNVNGREDAPIVITGAGEASQTVLLGRSTHNTIRIANSSHVIVRNLTVDGLNRGGDGVKAQGVAHHITLENLVIRGVGGDQQVVGISTNGAPTWNWTIRGNTIVGAGTGMYLGNSDGTNPFVAGVIERNVVRDTIGYNVQIKHQVPWPAGAGLPTARTVTIVRHNVFTKGANSAAGVMARPNLLIGDVPSTGPGSDNGYEVYGNFFYQNPTEALFQAEGNVAFYANLLVNDHGAAVNIQRHNGAVRDVRIFGNTVVAATSGIAVTGGDAGYVQSVTGNAVFAGSPITAPNATANVYDSYRNAPAYLNNPAAGWLPKIETKP